MGLPRSNSNSGIHCSRDRVWIVPGSADTRRKGHERRGRGFREAEEPGRQNRSGSTEEEVSRGTKRGRSSEWQPNQPIFPLRRVRREPDQQEFVYCASDIEALRNQESTRTVSAGFSQSTEVRWHRPDIVRYQHAAAPRLPAPTLQSLSYLEDQRQAPFGSRIDGSRRNTPFRMALLKSASARYRTFTKAE